MVLDEDESSSPFTPQTEGSYHEEEEEERKWANAK